MMADACCQSVIGGTQSILLACQATLQQASEKQLIMYS
jgi:hypothetical protein